MLHFLQVLLKHLNFLLKISLHICHTPGRGQVSYSLVRNGIRWIVTATQTILIMLKKANKLKDKLQNNGRNILTSLSCTQQIKGVRTISGRKHIKGQRI